MLKNKVLPIGGGIIAAFACVMLFDHLSHLTFPDVKIDLPEPTEENREEYMNALRDMINQLPLGALLTVMFGWIVGGFVGGAAAEKITPAPMTANALIVGFVLFLATLANLLMIPHPIWMAVIGLSAIVPAAWLGRKVAAQRHLLSGS